MDTPNLDRLVAQGQRFDKAYCQNPLCCPSRASMLSGMYSKNCGIYGNKHILEQNSPTIPRTLGAAGYRTCLIGKAHFNGEQFQGFQQRPYGDLYGQGHQPDPKRTPDKGFNGLGGVLDNAGPSGIPLPLTQTEICVSEAAKWLQIHIGSHADQPFMLKVSFDKPHFPINPPAYYYEKYAGKVSLPDYPADYLQHAVPYIQEMVRSMEPGEHYGKNEEIQLRALAAYYGCVEWVDDAIGRLLDTLDFLGLAENTLVVYASDHGEMAGEKGLWQKFNFYDESAKVPFLVRWPGVIEPGSVSNHPVGLIDLFPTFCEAAGLPIPDTCDGVSLLPLFKGEGKLVRDAIFSESVLLDLPEHAGCMIRTEKWKYNLYLDGHSELYDMENDPSESTNLTAEPGTEDIKKKLHARVVAFWEPEKQLARYESTPEMKKQKDQYFYSNQFILGDGMVVDGRP